MSTDYRVGYESGLKSQQVKIDELQEQLRIEREQCTEYFTDFHIATESVATALAWLNSSSKSDSAVKHAIDCLKGNKDESGFN